ncbi:MAG: (Fe-S)-binding protein [Deltaproteobacteria bacterium]|nr:(Fe-S)-binding protein [Deltaproteobacteria bacterium]
MTDLKKYQEELSKCSKCGFCQAFCPVYAVTGREPEVARGRNVQLLEVLKGELSISEIEPALSTCLLCRACVPSCFTGVKTDELVRAGREAFVEAGKGGIVQEIVFNSILPYPVRVAVLLKIAFFFKRIGFAFLANKLGIITNSLRIATSLMENPPRRFLRLRPSPQPTSRGIKVAWFKSCGFNYLLPETGEATIKLIEGLGYEVVIPENNCCGLPPYAHGYTEVSKDLARKNIEALERHEIVLTECGSCSSFLKEYAELLSDELVYAERARRVSERVVDSNEFIFNVLTGTVPNLRPLDKLVARNSGTVPTLKVTYHDPCHLSRYQGITREPREIIKSIPGIEFIELPEADWCCGGAGSYGITNNEISMKILERKINNIKKTGADILVTSCPACMIQLSYGIRREGLNIRVMHVNQLLALSLKP